jgi:F-type H+-transporting ATPase subunit a
MVSAVRLDQGAEWMVAAIEVDINHLFFWPPLAFEDTPLEFNRVTLLMVFASLVCVVFFLFAARRKALVPKGMQNLGETAYLFVRNNIAIDVIGPQGAKYANYLAAIFFFIFFMNLLEIVPGINFPVTSRMAIPAFLALFTWILFNVVGLVKQGPIRYLKETLFPPGVPKGIYVILTPIELFSVFIIRPLTLAVRLLANMMAGHVLLTIFFLFTHDFLVENFKPITAPLGILTFVVACALIVFELLVISIQAYIFTMLTAFYISESIHGHGEGEHDEVGGAQADPAKPSDYETEGVEAA